MLSRAYKLRFRRSLRLQKKQVGQLGAQAERHLENNLFKRLERLAQVRRFVVSWLVLSLLLLGSMVAQIRALNGYYQELGPEPGGTYTEGILGSFTNANPIYATTAVDSAVARLVFASLFKYDESNNLAPDLAESWSADDRGTQYTIKLKPGLTWQDGQPLTAEDVVFTYKTIQHPDARSPLFSSWQNVTISLVDDLTISFKLSNALASFPHSLTNGIIPKHLLNEVPMADMRTTSFNTQNPVGAGPFSWQAIQVRGGSLETREEQVALKAFENYHLGSPKLNSFVVRAFRSPQTLIQAYQDKQIDALVGLTSVPGEVLGDDTKVHNIISAASVMLFFRTTQEPFTDVKVRQALVRGVDRIAIMRELGYPTIAVKEPLLRGQLGYDAAFAQAGYNFAESNKLLDEAGWSKNAQDGLRYKDGAKLGFSLVTQSGGEYELVANTIKSQLLAVGVDVDVVLSEAGTSFQSTLSFHGYDALLYGITVGADPDVFVYWHSSQADVLAPQRLNFSEYKSDTADAALEAGRTRTDQALRAAKYQPFLRAWRDDAPAVGLYQPRFLYITHGEVYGLNDRIISNDVDRFANVHNWQIRTALQAPAD